MATTQGFPPWKDRIAAKDDCTVAAIRAAGAVIVGKTNVPELLQGLASRNRLFGTTRNAHDPERSSLGSSGGSGVAVSASMVPLASGSDTGGSIRGPASANGICGLRPTPGVVAHDDHIHAFNPSSVRGPMARSVEDTRLFLAAMAEGDGPDPYRHAVSADDVMAITPTDLRDLRVAVSCDLGFVKTDPAMRAAFEDKIGRIERLFGKVERRDPPLGEINRAYWILRPLKFFPGLVEMYKQDPPSVTEYKRVDFRRAFAEQRRGRGLGHGRADARVPGAARLLQGLRPDHHAGPLAVAADACRDRPARAGDAGGKRPLQARRIRLLGRCRARHGQRRLHA